MHTHAEKKANVLKKVYNLTLRTAAFSAVSFYDIFPLPEAAP
jgi:hypothetical protein